MYIYISICDHIQNTRDKCINFENDNKLFIYVKPTKISNNRIRLKNIKIKNKKINYAYLNQLIKMIMKKKSSSFLYSGHS